MAEKARRALPPASGLGKSASVTDIIIGARKTGPRKSRRLLLWLVLALVVYVAARWGIGYLTSYPNPDAAVPNSEIEVEKTNRSAHSEGPNALSLRFSDATLQVGPPAVLRAHGTPTRLGAMSGRLLSAQIADPLTRLAAATERGGDEIRLLPRLFGLRRGTWRLRHVDDGVPGHQLVELSGLARGAGVDYERLVRAEAAFDLASPDPASEGAALRAITLGLTVVTPLRGAAGERLLLGRSLATPGIAPNKSRHASGTAASDAPLVRFFRPEGVIAFASVGSSSSVGVVTGVNAEGLAISVHPLTTIDTASSSRAQPIALLTRDILENARTAEEAVSILEAATPLGSAIFVIVDAASQEPVVVERTPLRTGVLPQAKSRVTVDLLSSESLADEPESERNRRQRDDSARQRRARGLLEANPPRSPTDLALLLRDTRSGEGKPLPLGHRGQIADPSAHHVVIIDASALVLWVCTGPGPFGRFIAFDLRHELRGEGKQASAPPDIVADDAIVAAAETVARARAYVYRARAAARDDRMRDAREAIARALVLAADLPDALDVARTLGVASPLGERASPDSAASTPTTQVQGQEAP